MKETESTVPPELFQAASKASGIEIDTLQHIGAFVFQETATNDAFIQWLQELQNAEVTIPELLATLESRRAAAGFIKV